MEYSVVIPAAGSGSRLQLGYNKLLFQYQGKTILEYTVEIFFCDPRCRQIIVVCSPQETEVIAEKLKRFSVMLVAGGETRMESVYAGLKQVSERFVLVHDGARPFLEQKTIDAILETLREGPACIAAVPCKDTIKVVKDTCIIDTPKRAMLWQAQTPQAFHTEVILDAYEKAIENQAELTDDASAIERFTNQKVKVVMGSYDNIKITTAEDLHWFTSRADNER